MKNRYLFGFLQSITLTIIPFTALILLTSKTVILLILITCGVLQVIIHFFYFLDFNLYLKYKWYLISLLFTLIIITILVTGSIWIMYHMCKNLLI
ncbi:MAG: cytochrome o ubiquinol oxidase subunit IV [Candidatus Lightella neohaematopini]|nr:cytochrome o ubiquinol oxidase subunit IV [Candidatus Lightella neohaematopini]